MNSIENFNSIEEQIQEQSSKVDYDTKDLPIELIVDRFKEQRIFIPEYQREFVWEEERQSRLVESIMLGLPIPLLFLAQTAAGTLEIVDGSQRVRSLHAFLTDELVLEGLEKLTHLNGLKYSQLPESRRFKFGDVTLQVVTLSETATEAAKNDLFERLNRGSDLLRDMEKRKGIYRGEFTDFIYQKREEKSKILNKLAPLSKVVLKRQEHEELILRFFALVDSYPKFKTHRTGIAKFLDDYLERQNQTFNSAERLRKEAQLEKVLEFIGRYFAYGFLKKPGPSTFVARTFFESLSVGAHFAIEEAGGQLSLNQKIDVTVWLKDGNFSKFFKSGTDKTHSPKKIKARIDYVKFKLLSPEYQ